ncbi:hypothetical protein VTI74DRAFT_8461 [Chaetomium olivicolor]
MAPPAPVSPNQGDAGRPKEPSAIYKLVMTPIIFTSFLLSLILVDLRHSALRAHYHAEQPPTHTRPRRIPAWLHRILYRYQPYQYVVVDENGRPIPASTSPAAGGIRRIGSSGSSGSSDGLSSSVQTPAVSPGSPGSIGQGGEDYYHSKQRKLMKMEAAEAFEIRGSVLAALGVVSLLGMWVVWRVAGWAAGWGWGLVVRMWVF